MPPTTKTGILSSEEAKSEHEWLILAKIDTKMTEKYNPNLKTLTF